MFSKTGSELDSQVNQSLYQARGPNPLSQGGSTIVHHTSQGLSSGMPVDQTLGHQSLGTVQGQVGQGVSTGLGVQPQPTQLPRPVDQHTSTSTTPERGTGSRFGSLFHKKSQEGKSGHKKGLVTFRPLEARFNHDKDLLGKMDPYCKFKIGFHRAKSAIAKGQGTAPVWSYSVVVKHRNQEFAKLKVKDHDKMRLDDTIGVAKIPLEQLIASGNVDQWVPIEKHGEVVGEVHLIMGYALRDGGVSNVDTNAV